jgi:hypothetical protein
LLARLAGLLKLENHPVADPEVFNCEADGDDLAWGFMAKYKELLHYVDAAGLALVMIKTWCHGSELCEVR